MSSCDFVRCIRGNCFYGILLCCCLVETVPVATAGDDVRRVFAEFLAHAGYVYVDAAFEDVCIVGPYLFQELFAGVDFAGCTQQGVEQFEFFFL